VAAHSESYSGTCSGLEDSEEGEALTRYEASSLRFFIDALSAKSGRKGVRAVIARKRKQQIYRRGQQAFGENAHTSGAVLPEFLPRPQVTTACSLRRVESLINREARDDKN
jgi:hypothetical protein